MDPRYDKIATVVSPLLRDGDRLVVTETNGHVEVREFTEDDSTISQLREDDPELYGFLLALSYRINNATGCLWGLIALALVIGSCTLIHLNRPQFSVWWVYLLVAVTGVIIWQLVNEWCEAGAYWSHRARLLEMLAEAGLSRHQLLAEIRGDSELGSLNARLKTDAVVDVRL